MLNRVEISNRTIFLILFFLGVLWLVHEIKDILLLLFIAFILTSALHPWVDRLENQKIPRILAIFLIYLIGVFLIGLTIIFIFPPLIIQSIHLGNQLPSYIAYVISSFNLQSLNIESLTGQLGTIGENVIRLAVNVFSNILAFVTVFVFTFYFLLERKNLERYLRFLLSDTDTRIAMNTIEIIEDRLGAWVRGEFILMFTVGLATYVFLSLLQIDFALPLAILAGLLEVIPVIGPIIAAIPAIIVALSTTSQLMAFAVVGVYFIVQQLENNLIVLSVMQRAVNLPPHYYSSIAYV